MEELETYEMIVDDNFGDESGMNIVSLVENPAMKSQFLKFSEAITMKFDASKKELVGALIIPNMRILRDQPPLGKFYVMFSAPTITTILRKFQKNNFSNNISLQHSKRMVDGFVQEIWQKEFEEDKSNAYGFNLPVGTLFGKVKIEDERFWREYVDTDKVRGFSIEILSGLKRLELSEHQVFEALFNKIDRLVDQALKA